VLTVTRCSDLGLNHLPLIGGNNGLVFSIPPQTYTCNVYIGEGTYNIATDLGLHCLKCLEVVNYTMSFK